MSLQLNLAFVAAADDETGFFLWLSRPDGSFDQQNNKNLKLQLSVIPIWRRLLSGSEVRPASLTMEKASGDFDVEGLIVPMATAFDFLVDHAFARHLPPWMAPGPTWHFFADIADAIALLLENDRYRPHLLTVDKGGIVYLAAHWVLDKAPLERAGLLSEWLHRIPEEALMPKAIAQQPLHRWLSALLDGWGDSLIRRTLQRAYASHLKDWPEFEYHGSAASAWFYHLVYGGGGFYMSSAEPETKALMHGFKERIRRFVSAAPDQADVAALAAFKFSYFTERLAPQSVAVRLAPVHRDDPFRAGGAWEAELAVEVMRSDGDAPEWLPHADVAERAPAWIDWLDARVQDLMRFNGRLHFLDADGPIALTTEDVIDLVNHRDGLRERDIAILFPDWMKVRDRRRSPVAMRLSVRADGRAFSFDSMVSFNWRLSVGDLALTAEQFETLVREQRRFIQNGDEWVELPLEKLNAVYARLKEAGGSLKASGRLSEAMRLSLAQGDGEDGLSIEMSEEVERFLESVMKRPDRNLPVPPGLNGALRPYQKRGYTWLVAMREKGAGACLADDMGLGKTVQTIAYLLNGKEAHPGEPALIVCPTSVLGNWERELRTFSPSLKVYVHHGAERAVGEVFLKKLREVDVVVTSYALVVKDADWLNAVPFSSLILDEAQAIKNPAAKKSRALRRFHARHRLALTGTPIENRLEELWSIMDFLNPGYLGPLAAFRKAFIHPIEKKGDEKRAALLKRLIRPFLLRREKTDKRIIQDLPDKNERKIFCQLNEEQASLYQSVVDDLMEKMTQSAGIRRKGLILSALSKLKQICDHPALITKKTALATPGKLAALTELLTPIFAAGQSALVFTQYVRMGELLVRFVKEKAPDCPVYFLHGAVPVKKREEMIRAFQSLEGSGIFILSLRAGGFGLNLTNANHVIHFDRWWNPAVEDQATDRTYRIGQEQDVHVYKLITEGTLEKRIDDLIEKKKGLADQILGGGDAWVTEMSDEEIYDLVRLRGKVLA